MKPMEIVYWLRFALGVIAAFICVGYGLATRSISMTNLTFYTFLNGLSIALVIYLISYFALKRRFEFQVEKPQKLMTAGIGIYLISWIVFWTLFYTVIAGSIVS